MNQKIIHNDLMLLANKEIAEHSQRFFKTGKGEYGLSDIFLGIIKRSLGVLIFIFIMMDPNIGFKPLMVVSTSGSSGI